LADKLTASLSAERATPEAYEAHRIACGVPQGGVDFAYGDAFPHETNMDRLRGIDFDKGCYIGQEVVSRMQHRGTARTRRVSMIVEGFRPEAGVDVLAGYGAAGRTGSSAEGRGLATLRIDKVGEALKARKPLSAGGLALRLVDENDIKLAPKAEGV